MQRVKHLQHMHIVMTWHAACLRSGRNLHVRCIVLLHTGSSVQPDACQPLQHSLQELQSDSKQADMESLLNMHQISSQRCAADFLRVGALRRIDRRLLRHSLHCGAGGRERGDEASELADMLKAATSPAEAAVLRAELAEARRLCLLAGLPRAMSASKLTNGQCCSLA